MFYLGILQVDFVSLNGSSLSCILLDSLGTRYKDFSAQRPKDEVDSETLLPRARFISDDASDMQENMLSMSFS